MRPGAGTATAALETPLVQVGARATLFARSVSGQVRSEGATTAAGSTYGGLALAGTARTRVAVEYPLHVTGTAVVDGVLQVDLPPVRRLPPDGVRTPLVTADGGVSGRFDAVVARPPARGSLTLEYTPTGVYGVHHAP